ncbi:lactate utilization protein C [Ureibacillus sp. NPDC094379]
MQGSIQNREKFLKQITSRLGRERTVSSIEKPTWTFHPQDDVLTEATNDDLLDMFEEHSKKIHTSMYRTHSQNLLSTIKEVVKVFGGGPVIISKDERFAQWELEKKITEQWPLQIVEWDYTRGEENIKQAEKANVGITISEMTLAESATIVTFSNQHRGRTINFLPKHLIALIPKSSLVPRMTQAARKIRVDYLQTGHVPSCINFITGPSNSADIELNLVVGVHGPVKAAYIVIEDL